MSEMENLLTWKTAEEVNTKLFEIERSSDGVNFSKVHSQDAEGSQTENFMYILILWNMKCPLFIID